MVLLSTLIIDTSESDKRTEANHSAAWFSRFSLSLGPLVGLIMLNYQNFDAVLLTAVVSSAVAIVLILTVNFPFRTPSDSLHIVSLDRFFLPSSAPLFVNMQLIAVAIGLLLSLGLSERFYGVIMVGFLLALLAQRFVFRDAELKSEVVTGLILLLIVFILIYTVAHCVVCGAAVVRTRRRHYLCPIPTVLHQTKPPLPARHVAEHLFPGVGEWHRPGHRAGLCVLPQRCR